MSEYDIKTPRREFLAKTLRHKVLNIKTLFLGGSSALPTLLRLQAGGPMSIS